MRSYDPPPRATPAIWLVRDAVFFFFYSHPVFPLRGGRAPSAAPSSAARASAGAVRRSPVAVAVGEAPPQPVYPPAESHVLRVGAAALRVGQRAVVQHRGGRETQVEQGEHFVSP